MHKRAATEWLLVNGAAAQAPRASAVPRCFGAFADGECNSPRRTLFAVSLVASSMKRGEIWGSWKVRRRQSMIRLMSSNFAAAFLRSAGLNAFHRRTHVAHAQRNDFVHELDHDERAQHDDGELHHGVNERAVFDRGGHRFDAVLSR